MSIYKLLPLLLCGMLSTAAPEVRSEQLTKPLPREAISGAGFLAVKIALQEFPGLSLADFRFSVDDHGSYVVVFFSRLDRPPSLGCFRGDLAVDLVKDPVVQDGLRYVRAYIPCGR